MMEEKIIYEYCLLRYVPDIEREEFVNVGLLMMSKRFRWMQCELHVDEARIQTLSRKADVPRLKLQLKLFMRDDVPERDLSVEERYRWMAAVKSAVIQTSQSHPGILTAPAGFTRQDACRMLQQKFEELFNRLIVRF